MPAPKSSSTTLGPVGAFVGTVTLGLSEAPPGFYPKLVGGPFFGSSGTVSAAFTSFSSSFISTSSAGFFFEGGF